MKNRVIASGIAAIMFMVSCAIIPYAREVKKKPTSGGVIALRSNPRAEDRTEADRLMKVNCGASDVKILEEGEVVVGQKTNASSDYYNNKNQKPSNSGFSWLTPTDNVSTSSETVQLKEWQITYECLATNAASKQETVARKAKAPKKN